MGSKRKRSADDSPLSMSSYGGFSSTPESLSPTPRGNAMDLDASSSTRFNFDFGRRSWGLPVTRVEASDLGLRTRKRFRDNRPDEKTIHQKTMHILFSAQRAQPTPIPSLSIPTPDPQPTPLPIARPQKSTLHSFWNLPAPPVTIQPPTPTPGIFTLPPTQIHQPNVPHCEDCDTPLSSDADRDVDMDMDMNGGCVNGVENAFACNDCGRTICGTCAVVSRTRHCLQCATTGRNSRRWW